MWNPFKKKEGGSPVFGRLEYVNYADGNLLSGEEEKGAEQPEQLEQAEQAEGELIEKPLPRLRGAVRGLLLAVIALGPVWFLPFTAPNDVLIVAKQILLFGVVMAGLVIWVVIIARQGGLVFKRSGWEGGILAVGGSSLLASIFSSQVYNSFSAGGGFVTLATMAVFFFLAINFFRKEDSGRLMDFFLLGATVTVLIGMLGVAGAPVGKLFGLFFPHNIAISNQFNTGGSVNTLGALAALAVVLSLAYQVVAMPRSEAEGDVSQKKEFFWSVARVAGMVIFSAWLVIVNWWVFYAVVAVGMVAVVLSSGFVKRITGFKSKLNPLQLVLPMVFLVISIMLILGGKFFNLDVSRAFRQSLPTEVTLSQTGSWEIAKGVAGVKPVFGFGDENFTIAFDRFKPSSINESRFWNFRFANGASELFDLFVERGAVGLAAFLFLLFYVGRSAFIKEKEGGEAGRYLWVAMPAFMASLVLFALFPFHFVLGASFWFLLALMGVAVSGRQRALKIKMDDASLSSLITSLVLVAVLVGGAMGGYILFQKYSSQVYFARAARVPGATRDDVDKAIDLLNKAIAADNRNDLLWGNFGTLILQKISAELNNKTDKPEEVRVRLEALTRSAVQVANQMTVTHKNDAINWFNAGFMYENLAAVLSGADEAAISAYREYLKRAPQDPNGYLRIGSVYLTRADRATVAIADARTKKLTIENEKEVLAAVAADYQKAEESLKKATELKPDLATALYNLGIVYERQGKLKEAIKQLELLRSGNPNNSGLAFELSLLYYRDGQKDNALAEVARAVALFSDYSNARWYLALMLEERGQIDLAIGQLREILKLEINKDNAVVQAKIAALEAGQREIPPAKVTSKKPLEPAAAKRR